MTGHSDWDFLKMFYQREEIAKQQIHGLNSHVAQLNAALQHAGYTSQQDRKALNKSHTHMMEFQEGFHQSEAGRARLENELHDERQEHRMCQENLDHERKRHVETEKTLECFWNSHNRLREVLSKVHCHARGQPQEMTYDVTDLVLETTSKWDKIQELERMLQQQKSERQAESEEFERKLQRESIRHAEESMAQAQQIRDLEFLLQSEQMKSFVGEEENLEAVSKRRRRSRGKGKGKKGASPEVFSQKNSSPVVELPRSYGDLAVVKKEVE